MHLALIANHIKNEPRYRADQIWKGIFVDLVESWEEVTVLSKTLRAELAEVCPLAVDAEIFIEKGGETAKALIRLSDRSSIEAVLMRHNDGRNTVCVSSQVGCPMACAFCATGKMGLVRSLNAGEIVMQVLFFARLLKKEGKRVSGVVFMGMGEPFANYTNVMDAVRILNDHKGLDIGARHISISTCGVLGGIERFTKETLQINLAISLHASNDVVRRTIMPVAKTCTIAELLRAIDVYIATTKRKVMFEYLMLRDVNDKDEHAEELVKLLRGKLCMVNLIAYNDTGVFASSSQERIVQFKKILEKGGVATTVRFRLGREVEGACGQLATKKSIG